MNLKKYTYYLASIWKLLSGIQPRNQVIKQFLGPASGCPQVIHLTRQGVCFKIRSAMDIWTVKETFLDRFYEKFGSPIGDGWIVVDIGSGIGDFSILAAKQHASNKVFAFEPTRESYHLLLENLRLNNVSNVKAFPYAIWEKSGDLIIDTTSGEAVQYISYSVGQQSQIEEGQLVKSLSLEDAFSFTGLNHCNLLKVDCEGAEFPILLNSPDEVLNRIDRIILEYHEFSDKQDHMELVNFLHKKGFTVRTYPNYVHDYLGYLYACR